MAAIGLEIRRVGAERMKASKAKIRKLSPWVEIALLASPFALPIFFFVVGNMCPVAPVLVINNSEQYVAATIYVDRPVRRDLLAEGEWEWFAAPIVAEGDLVLEAIKLGDASVISAPGYYVVTQGLTNALVVEIGETEASISSLFYWLFPDVDWKDGGTFWKKMAVESIPATVACPVGLVIPPSG